MRNLCYLGSVAILILTFMVHLEVIGLDKGVIPFGFFIVDYFSHNRCNCGGKGQTQYRFPI